MIRVLSIDDCGLRGLTPLLILQHLMQEMNGLDPEVLPCEVFDLICGTGTGGLLAVLLGRLGLSCTEAAVAYERLQSAILGAVSSDEALQDILNRDYSNGFPTDKFEDELKRLVIEYTGDGDALMRPQSGSTEGLRKSTKTLVTPVAIFSEADASTIRSYVRSPKSSDAAPIEGHEWTIRDAARGSSSPTRPLSPLAVAVGGFHDANLIGYSNPAMMAYSEALDLFGSKTEMTLVSLGMGIDSRIDPVHLDSEDAVLFSQIDEVVQALALPDLSATADGRLREIIRQFLRVASSAEMKHLYVQDRVRSSNLRHAYIRLNPSSFNKLSTHVFIDIGQRQIIKQIRADWLKNGGGAEITKAVGFLTASTGKWVVIRGQTCLGSNLVTFTDIDDEMPPDEKAAKIKAKCYQWEAAHPNQRIRCFTTEGLAKSQVGDIHSAPMDLYVRVLIDESWIFFQGESRRGGTCNAVGFPLDDDDFTNFDIVKALEDANNDPSIVAFNSARHAKNTLGDRTWTPQYTMPHQGVWVRNN